MSKPITKEMWEDIEAEMSGSWVVIDFLYKGHAVEVRRTQVSESKTCLQVYIDGFIKGEWMSLHGIPETAPAIITDVWKKKTTAKYSAKFKQEVTKIWGKRRVKNKWPDFDGKWEFYIPDFSKASVLCRQFKKLDGLELTKAMFLNLEERTL
ncbi:hypothetical protein ACU6DI_003930 [Vibrio navarrensis]